MESDSLVSERAVANQESQLEARNSQAESNWIKTLLHVNGSILPGFDIEHIRSMGTDDSPGLRVEIVARAGVSAAPLLFIKLQIKCGDIWHLVAVVVLPFSENIAPLSADLLEVANTTTMKALFTIPPTYISSATVIDPTNGLDFDLMRLGLPDPQHTSAPSRSSTFIRPKGSKIICITAEAKANQLVVEYPAPFWRQIHRQPMATRTIANRIKSMLSPMNQENQILFWITFPFDQEWRRNWRLFFGNEHKESPYGKITWEKRQADNTPSQPFRALLIPFPDSEWIAAGNDKQEYGIDATGLPTAYLMAVNTKTAQSPIPDIGTLVEVDLSIAQGYFHPPKQPQTALHIRKIAVEAQGVIKAAENKVRIAKEEAQAKLSGIREGGPIAEDFALLVSKLFSETAAKGLMPYINKVSNKAKAKYPSGPEDAQRWVDALEVASQLRVRSGENDNAHVKRIAKWVKTQGVSLRTLKPNKLGEPFIGYRLDPPCNIPTEAAIFHLEVPKQPDWPHGFKQPPLRIAIPKVPLASNSSINVYSKKDFFFATEAEVVEVECLEIRVVDNLELEPKESDQLESALRKIAVAITTIE